MPRESIVGIIANPAAGHDLRRLVAGASVDDNAEKGRMVFRLLTGLAASGVESVVMMPGGDGISASLHRAIERRSRERAATKLPSVDVLEMSLEGNHVDTASAVDEMMRRGVAAIVVLGGDGTHRIVARTCGDTPICALSCGTNNAFPMFAEATVAGIATGLVATGRGGPLALRREKAWRVSVNQAVEHDIALVDVALSHSPWKAARAIYSVEQIREVLVAFASPSAIGLSAIAAMLEPVPRYESHGLRVWVSPRGGPLQVMAPLVPGLVVPVTVTGYRRIAFDDVVRYEDVIGSLALDGEREIELSLGDEVEIRLDNGPVTIDIESVLEFRARHASQELSRRSTIS